MDLCPSILGLPGKCLSITDDRKCLESTALGHFIFSIGIKTIFFT